MQQIVNFVLKNSNRLLFLLLLVLSLLLTIQSHSYHKSKIISSANFFTGGIYQKINNVDEYFNLKSQNDELAKENARLKSLLFNQKDTTKLPQFDSIKGVKKMDIVVSKVINNTSADERVQMQKIINKMFEPVFFQKYNNTISWNQFVPKELKKEIAFRDFSINYSFKLNTQNFLAVMKLNLNGQKVEGQINYECKKGRANNQTKTKSDNVGDYVDFEEVEE
mgnify:CR=1 FL=1